MAITHVTAIRNSFCDVVADAVDAGSLNPAGRIGFYSSGATLLAAVNFAAPPAFGNPANGKMQANSLPRTATVLATGTPTTFQWQSRQHAQVLAGTVGAGQDATFTNLSWNQGDEISINECEYVASP